MAYRELTDREGREWRVWDTYPGRLASGGVVSQAFAQGWLTFECVGEKRRLAPVPAGWEESGREGLLRFLAQSVSGPPSRDAAGAAARESADGPSAATRQGAA